MAISTYDELKTAVATWLNRTTITSRVPDFITLGEAKLNRVLRPHLKEAWTTMSTSTSTPRVNFPTGALEILELRIDDDALLQVAPTMLGDDDTAREPVRFAIVGSQVQFECVSDQVYTVDVRMIQKLDIATDSTNWLLTSHPDIYLYASLIAAEPALKNDARISTWKSMLAECIGELETQSSRNRGRAKLVTDMHTRAGYNVLSDR